MSNRLAIHFAQPFHGFDGQNSIFASVWLFFLVPYLWQTLIQEPGVHTAVAIAVILLLLLFALVYAFAFGASSYYPRNATAHHRWWLYFLILGALALVLVGLHPATALMCVPYLCAYILYTTPTVHSLLRLASVMILCGTTVMLVRFFTPGLWINAISVAIIAPVFITMMALLHHWFENKQTLEENLRLSHQREAIAVDVHDLLGHSLTVINLKSELARRLIDNNPEQAKRELEAITSLSRSSLADVRSTVTRMRRPDFTGELHAARRALETVGINADLPEDTVDVGTNQTIFSWALRELVTNVVRHSQATQCVIRATTQKLYIHDNGIGFTTPPAHEHDGNIHGGLAGLTRRVDDAGGEVVFLGKSGVLITMNGNKEPL